MTSVAQTLSPPLPRWAMLLGSGLIAFHLFSLGIHVLATQSGPWFTASFGSSPSPGPVFAERINNLAGRYYLGAIHMTQFHHFASNAPETPSVFFEVRLKDDKGRLLKTLKFPDDNANYWINHRQHILAQSLGDDQPVQPLEQESILPAGASFPTVAVWMPAEGEPLLRLTKVSQLEIPKNRPMSRPSNWSVILAQAYARHLCRQHGAASAELIRHSRAPILPMVLFMPNALPRDTFAETICSFGEYRP